MKYLMIMMIPVLLLIGCSNPPSYKVGECYSDGLENYRRVIRINNQYKSAWYYQLYVDGKDVGEFHGSIEFVETVFEFKRKCPK